MRVPVSLGPSRRPGVFSRGSTDVKYFNNSNRFTMIGTTQNGTRPYPSGEPQFPAALSWHLFYELRSIPTIRKRSAYNAVLRD